MVTAKRFLAFSMVLVAVSGCHDAAYERALAEREQRIHNGWNDYMMREAGRPLNMERLNQTATELQALYSERLDLTLRMLEKKRATDQRNWLEDEPARLEHLRRMQEGDPDQIPQTWADMTH